MRGLCLMGIEFKREIWTQTHRENAMWWQRQRLEPRLMRAASHTQKLGEARSLLQSPRGTARCHLHLELLALGSATGWASAARSLQFTELILPAVGG